MVICLIAFPKKYFLQIYVTFITQTIYFGIILHSKPLITPAQNYSDFFNELTVMSSVYFLFLFTDYISDASMSDLIGWSLVLLLAFNIFINAIQILVVFVKNVVFKLKLNYLRWLHKKLTKKVEERRI